MPIITNLEDKILQLVRSNQYQWFTVGVNLGGTSGEAGGSGIPLGGFIGQLIQSKVTFDTTEAATLDIPTSGASLVDNLNRIRYWINTISGGGGDTVRVSSDDTVANYLEDKIVAGTNIVVTTLNDGGDETLEITATLSGGGSYVEESLFDANTILKADTDDTPEALTVANWTLVGRLGGDITDFDIEDLAAQETPTNDADFIMIWDSGESDFRKVLFDDFMDEANLEDLGDVTITSPADGESLTYDDGTSNWINTLISGGGGSDSFEAKVSANDTTEGYLEDKIVAGDNVTITTLNDGSNETLEITSTASGGGGGDVSIDDEGGEITSAVTSIDFVGSQVTATNVGDDVTVTISGIMVDAPDFVGVRTYKTTDETWPAGQGWRNVDFGAENYDTDSMWSAGAGHDTPSNGYYHTYAQVTFSGGLSTSNALQLGLFRDSFPIAMGFRGYHDSADEIATYIVATDYYYTAGQDAVLKLVVHDGSDQPVLMSGVANTFMCTHQIQAVVASAEETPVACNVYATGYDTDPVTDTWTEMRFDAERHDTDTMYTFGTSDTDININTAGYYNIKLQLMWHGLNETPFAIAQRILLNGTDVLAQTYDMSVDNGGARAEGSSLISGCDYNLSVSDVITAEVWHDRGSTLNDAIRPGDGSSFITLHRIGPS